VLRKFLGEENVLLTPSGRGGLYFILKNLEQSRVIVPAYTCKAVVEAARIAGKQVEFVETAEHGFNMDTALLAGKTGRDAVVIATHQFGIPCNIEAIRDICRETGAFLLEDCAASLGTRVNDILTGHFGDASFFSLDSTKLIHVPLKGGFITVKDPLLFKQIEDNYHQETIPVPFFTKIRWLMLAAILLIIENRLLYRLFYFINFTLLDRVTADSKVLSLERTPFYRFDLAEWQAYFALKQFEQINHLIEQRRQVYSEYRERLEECPGIVLPPPDTNHEWACIRFPICIYPDKMPFYKEAVKRGVDFSFSFTFIASPAHFHRSHAIASAVLDLPFYHKLTEQELEAVVSTIMEIQDRL
jgi:dTDP-4-amino-4,6-dideoxygalactose transaminase